MASIALILIFSSDARAQDPTSSVTGCLDSDGNFSRFAFGDAPEQACATDQDELALRLDDLQAAVVEPFFVTLRLGEKRLIAAIGRSASTQPAAPAPTIT